MERCAVFLEDFHQLGHEEGGNLSKLHRQLIWISQMAHILGGYQSFCETYVHHDVCLGLTFEQYVELLVKLLKN